MRLGGRTLGFGEADCVFVALVEVDDRGKSKDCFGVASEKVTDFRLAGGKKPSALRGMRPICVALESLGRSTQESCFHGGSGSAFEFE